MYDIMKSILQKSKMASNMVMTNKHTIQDLNEMQNNKPNNTYDIKNIFTTKT